MELIYTSKRRFLAQKEFGKVFKDFGNYFSLCQVFDELLSIFQKISGFLHCQGFLTGNERIPTDAGKNYLG